MKVIEDIWALLASVLTQACAPAHVCVHTTQALLFLWVWLAHLLFMHVPRLRTWAFLTSALGSHTDSQGMLPLGRRWQRHWPVQSPAAAEAGVVDPLGPRLLPGAACCWQSCRLHAASSPGLLFRLTSPFLFPLACRPEMFETAIKESTSSKSPPSECPLRAAPWQREFWAVISSRAANTAQCCSAEIWAC